MAEDKMKEKKKTQLHCESTLLNPRINIDIETGKAPAITRM